MIGYAADPEEDAVAEDLHLCTFLLSTNSWKAESAWESILWLMQCFASSLLAFLPPIIPQQPFVLNFTLHF